MDRLLIEFSMSIKLKQDISSIFNIRVIQLDNEESSPKDLTKIYKIFTQKTLSNKEFKYLRFAYV